MNKVADPSVLKRRRAPSINARHSPGYEDLPSGMCCGVLDTTPEEDDEPMYRIGMLSLSHKYKFRSNMFKLVI